MFYGSTGFRTGSRVFQAGAVSRIVAALRSYQRFNRMFRYSIFIGGPVCTCMPINPSSLRFGASSSNVMLIKRPFNM